MKEWDLSLNVKANYVKLLKLAPFGECTLLGGHRSAFWSWDRSNPSAVIKKACYATLSVFPGVRHTEHFYI